ncbi:MAG: NAD(P)/FAD-dependent oxidoreductase [Vicinamibacterales bacterium]
MDDVTIVGGGPAGSFAGILLARGGARVRIFDRSTFPRHKLCGDTLNPGAVAILWRHLDASSLLAQGRPIDGMLLTGPGRVSVRGRYRSGRRGCAITREVLDAWLVGEARRAGVQVDEGVVVRGLSARVDRGTAVVSGVTLQARDGRTVSQEARLVIAADGRRSSLAFGRSLARQPRRPRRWAIGAYFTDVDELTTSGEMHVREDGYLGVAPLPGGLTNACLVVPQHSGASRMVRPDQLLHDRLQADEDLRRRFARARALAPPVMLGPMAVDAEVAGAPGLLLTGDAAGFIDPMTGDGLRLALTGSEIAAEVALEVLDGRLPAVSAHLELTARRRRAFRAKWRFNRAIRALVAAPRGVTAATVAARIVPSAFESIIRYAGDC